MGSGGGDEAYNRPFTRRWERARDGWERGKEKERVGKKGVVYVPKAGRALISNKCFSFFFFLFAFSPTSPLTTTPPAPVAVSSSSGYSLLSVFGTKTCVLYPPAMRTAVECGKNKQRGSPQPRWTGHLEVYSEQLVPFCLRRGRSPHVHTRIVSCRSFCLWKGKSTPARWTGTKKKVINGAQEREGKGQDSPPWCTCVKHTECQVLGFTLQ